MVRTRLFYNIYAASGLLVRPCHRSQVNWLLSKFEVYLLLFINQQIHLDFQQQIFVQCKGRPITITITSKCSFNIWSISFVKTSLTITVPVPGEMSSPVDCVAPHWCPGVLPALYQALSRALAVVWVGQSSARQAGDN